MVPILSFLGSILPSHIKKKVPFPLIWNRIVADDSKYEYEKYECATDSRGRSLW